MRESPRGQACGREGLWEGGVGLREAPATAHAGCEPAGACWDRGLERCPLQLEQGEQWDAVHGDTRK